MHYTGLLSLLRLTIQLENYTKAMQILWEPLLFLERKQLLFHRILAYNIEVFILLIVTNDQLFFVDKWELSKHDCAYLPIIIFAEAHGPQKIF